MQTHSTTFDHYLLDDWQRDFPITPRPFAKMAKGTGHSEGQVIARLAELLATGRITRVGGTCAPNSLSASTLAAIAAPPADIEKVAAIISNEPGVNHSYEREDKWNLWFVATGPDREHVNQALARIEQRSGLRVLDLRLVRPFNVDLGFHMNGTTAPVRQRKPQCPVDKSAIRTGDHALMQALTSGLPLTPWPYAALADQLGLTETEILARIKALANSGILSRLGVIVRHRALGWRSNAMVVWDIGHDAITQAGPALAALPGVTLCYERVPVAGVWPYRLYSMIHARSRDEAHAVLKQATALPALRGVPYKALFSTRCFKQQGAMITQPQRAAE